MKPRKKSCDSHSLLITVLSVYLLIFVVPIIVLYASLYGSSQRSAEGDGGRQLLSSLQSISGTMDEVFLSVNFLQSQLQANPAFSDKSFLIPAEETENESYKNFRLCQDISMELYKLFLSNSYLYSLEVYNPYAHTYFGNRIGRTREIIKAPPEEKINSLRSTSPPKEWGIDTSHSFEPPLLFTSFSRPFCSSNPHQFLYSRASISLETFQSRVKEYDPSQEIQFFTYLEPSGWFPLCGPDAKDSSLAAAASSLDRLTDQARQDSHQAAWNAYAYKGRTFVAASFRSPYTGWLMGAAVPLSHYNSSVSLLSRYWVYFLAALGLIFIMTALFVYFYLIRPMRLISGKMRAAEYGDLSIRIYSVRKDELGYIGHRLNVLLDNLDKLIHENYEAKLLKEQFELRFIQTQLKEHFIYNTLDSIHWIADRHHVPEISGIIFDLSRFFRLTLNSGSNFITVAQEAEVLSSYLALSNVRMDGTIRSDLEIGSGVEQETVVKYLFQPVLENAVVHGLRPAGGGHISIRFKRAENGNLLYCVQDDGAGISPGSLAKIRLAVQTDAHQDKYFALINLNRQMRLYFKDNFTFSIDSEIGKGTEVTLIFPAGCGNGI